MMGGVIGATSGKFVMMAAMLVLHGRIDNDRTTIAIAPGLPTSTITPDRRVGNRIKLGIGAVHVYTATPPAGAQSGPAIALTIGRDVLDANPLLIDFPGHEVHLLLPSEARHREAGMIAVPVTDLPDGRMTVPLSIDHRPATPAVLDLSAATTLTAPAQSVTIASIGAADMPGIRVIPGTRAMVGLLAFARSTVIFDLGHHRIWLRPQR